MEQNELLCEMKSKVEELEQEVKCKKVMNEAKSMNENKKIRAFCGFVIIGGAPQMLSNVSFLL